MSPWWIAAFTAFALLACFSLFGGDKAVGDQLRLFPAAVGDRQEHCQRAGPGVGGLPANSTAPVATVDPTAKPSDDHTYPKLKKKFFTVLPPMAVGDAKLDEALRKTSAGQYTASEPVDNTAFVLMVYMLVTLGLFVGLWFLFRKARDSFFAGGLTGGFAKSGARRYDSGAKPVTFGDVAGLEGVKHELQEVVEFLRNPAKFQRLGAGCPRACC